MKTTTEIMFCCSSKIWEEVSKVFSFSKELVEFFQFKRFWPEPILYFILVRLHKNQYTARRQCFGRER
jgi:hypothetical protein